jgi:hypothetical protein
MKARRMNQVTLRELTKRYQSEMVQKGIHEFAEYTAHHAATCLDDLIRTVGVNAMTEYMRGMGYNVEPGGVARERAA